MKNWYFPRIVPVYCLYFLKYFGSKKEVQGSTTGPTNVKILEVPEIIQKVLQDDREH